MTSTTCQHGTRGRYQAGCRCEACRGVESAYHREYYQRWKLTPAYKAWRARLKLSQALRGIRPLGNTGPLELERLPSPAPTDPTEHRGADRDETRTGSQQFV
jgi:hypothetical protein